MSIAVVNIRDLIKYAIILTVVSILIITGIVIVKGKEKWSKSDNQVSFSFLDCLAIEIPIMQEEKLSEKEGNEKQNLKILDTELAMLYNIEENEIAEREDEKFIEENEDVIEKKVDIAENVETKVISENNIEASFTDTGNDIQVKNQSKYDISEILANPNYELQNKDKVIIYHTHTCESYTSSENYSYEMTGAYRTTDLNYTVARVRR